MTMLRGILITTSLLGLIWGCAGTDRRGIDERTTALPVKQTDSTEGKSAPPPSRTLRAVTLNLAHGRKDSLNQLLVSEEQIRENLDDIAAFLKLHGRNGIPFYILYPGDSTASPRILPQILTRSMVLDAISEVGNKNGHIAATFE